MKIFQCNKESNGGCVVGREVFRNYRRNTFCTPRGHFCTKRKTAVGRYDTLSQSAIVGPSGKVMRAILNTVLP